MNERTNRHRPVAVITGASQGLGLALAEALAARGWALVVDARRAARLDTAVARLSSLTEVVGLAGDVNDPEHRRALARAAAELGRVDLVVNNASTLGASPLPTLAAITPDVLRRTFDTNVVAPIAVLQALDEVLADDATIVDISDRPEAAASVPGLLALIESDVPSGRYEARAFTPAESRQS